MNHVSAPHVGPLSRASTDYTFATLGQRLHAARRALLARWRLYRMRRREARSLAAVSEMDAHILRDIGAPDQLIARAAEGRRTSQWSDGLFRISMVLVAVAGIGMTEPAPAAEAAPPLHTGNARAQSEMVGVFTGEMVNGAPVYRFPTMIVAAPRSAPRAKPVEHVARPRPVRTPAKGAA